MDEWQRDEYMISDNKQNFPTEFDKEKAEKYRK